MCEMRIASNKAEKEHEAALHLSSSILSSAQRVALPTNVALTMPQGSVRTHQSFIEWNPLNNSHLLHDLVFRKAEQKMLQRESTNPLPFPFLPFSPPFSPFRPVATPATFYILGLDREGICEV
jgi:hypothetical protein